MKKTILQRFFLSLCLMIVGCLWGSAAWAETITLSQETIGSLLGTRYAKTDFTYSNITWGRNRVYNNNGGIQIEGGTSKALWNKTAIPGAITKIIVTQKTNPSTLTVGTTASPATNTKTNAASKTTTYEFSASDNYRYFKIAATSKYSVVTSIEITYEAAGVPSPTFSLTSGTYYGDQTLELSSTVDGGTIYYTTNGTDPSKTSTKYTTPINLTAPSTLTIKAIVVDSEDNLSRVVSNKYNILTSIANTQETALTTAEAISLINTTTAEQLAAEKVYVKGTISKIDEFNSKYGSITYWLDGDTFEVYSGLGLNNTQFSGLSDIEVGAKVIIYGNIKKFNDTYEFDKNNYLVDYNFVPKTLSSVTVSGTPTKTTYEEGDAFNPAGLEVTGTYSDGSNETITEGITWNVTPATLTAGLTSVDVTATVDGVTSSPYTVTGLTVTAARTLASVTLEGNPTKTTYYVGETFDPSGIRVMANYTTGDPEDVTAEAIFTYNNAALTIGTTSVKVSATYNEVKSDDKNYDITVNKKASSISIANLTIGVGEISTITATTTPANAVLTYTITDGNEYVTLDGNQLTGSAVGTATIKASYEGDNEYEAAETSFTVTVSDIKTATINSFSTTSGNFTDNTDISFASYKGDGTSEPALNSNAIRLYKKGSGKTSGGYITITAVDGAMIQSIKLTTGSNKPNTTIGYCVDDEAAPTTGDQVTNPTDYNISGLNNKSVSIYCLDGTNYLEVASLEVKYTKEKLTLSSIALSGEYQTVFTQYDVFNHDNLVVTATYSNGSTRDVTSLASFSTPDITTIGEKTVTVSYTEDEVTKEATYDITVNKKIYSQIEPLTAYRKITSTAEIVDGGQYVIVYTDGKKGLLAGASSVSNATPADVVFEGNGTISTANAAAMTEITFEHNAGANYYLNIGNSKYIKAGSSSTTELNVATGKNNNALWTIDFDAEGNVEITSVAVTDRGILYSTDNRFKNYKTSNRANKAGYPAIQLYQKVGEMSVAKATGGITTFVSNYDYLMPENLTGYIVTNAANAGTITTKFAYSAGQAVPAYTPLIIKSREDYADDETSKTYNLIALNKGLSYTGTENMLEYTRDENGFTKTSKDESVYYYKLAIKDGNVGFYWGKANGAAFIMTKPSTAYLTVPQSMAVQGFVLNLEEGETTGIATVVTNEDAPIYNLQGIRMNGKNLPKGIYIQGGKKFMVK